MATKTKIMATKTKKTAVKTKKTATKKGSPAKIVPGFPPGHPNYRSTKDRVKANSKKEASARNAHLTSAGRVPARYKKMIKRGK